MAKRQRKSRRTYDVAAARRREQRALSRSLRNQPPSDEHLTRQSRELSALLRMDPFAFEELVGELVRSMGYDVTVTQRSRDGGVDIEAHDSHPIRGGTVIFSVKRYRRTVQPAHVRELWGTLQHRFNTSGASRAVLVTTSHFGPSSLEFVTNKPLSLITGSELLALMARQGVEVPTDLLQAPPGATEPEDAATVDEPESSETYTLGFTWEGEHPYDICVIACEGDKAADEGQFVFYNNPSNPEGTIKFTISAGDERACVLVHFDRLPAAVDRLILIAAADTDTDPGADMSAFTKGMIRLFSPDGDELDSVSLSGGLPGFTAGVLGHLERQTDGDWTFTPVSIGHPGGLLSIVTGCGIEVDD